MPVTPVDTTTAIRSEANVNINAVDSVIAQAEGHLAEIGAWDPSPAKGQLRDQLERLVQNLRSLKSTLQATSRLADNVLNTMGAGGGPDVPPTPITWSTGDW